jgi:hypothetical protein
LLPGRARTDQRSGYTSFARITEAEKPRAARTIISGAISRRRDAASPIDCVLIDCGAEGNDIVSAGFVIATYGFILSSANTEFAADIPRYEAIHRQRYPNDSVCPTMVVVNMAGMANQRAWHEFIGGCFFLPDDPEVRRLGQLGTYDLNVVGLNEYFLSVLNVLKSMFRPEHMHLIPDEKDVWVRPRIREIISRRIPHRLLQSRDFRGSYWLTVAAIALSVIALITCSYLLFTTHHGSAQAGSVAAEMQGPGVGAPLRMMRGALAVAWAGSAIGAVILAIRLRKLFRRRQLLVELIERGDDTRFLERLLRTDPEKPELRWLRLALESELNQ